MSVATLEKIGVESADSAPQDKTGDTITKALQLLDVFREAGPRLGVSEIAKRARVPRSTAYRVLAYLEEGGYVARSGRAFVLGSRLFELGNSTPHCGPLGLREVAMPYLSNLFVQTNETVHLGVLDGSDVIYLEKIYGHRNLRTPTSVGTRMPATCCSLGKAMLAFSDRAALHSVLANGLTRRTSYSLTHPSRLLSELQRANSERVAYDREEAQIGLVCAASPILSGGRAVGAVSLAGRATEFRSAPLAAFVQKAAEAISRDLAEAARVLA